MKAVALTRPLPIDHPEALIDVDLPTPAVEGHDLLVEVRAVSVNPVDVKLRAGGDAGDGSPRVLGWDVSGVVRAVGGSVTLFRPGDEVWYAGSVIRPGANSELHVVDERIVGRKPRSISHAEAAALPLTLITAWEALFERLGLPRDGSAAGRTLLLIGAAGGVGSIAIQLARRLAGLTVIATASRPASVDWVRRFGADHVIDHRQPLAPQLQALGFPEVDCILCLTHTGEHFPAFASIIRPQGRIGLIVRASAPLDIDALMAKSVTIAWEMMFTRSMYGTADMSAQHALLDEAADLVDRGVLQTTLSDHYGRIDAANLRRAHAAIEGGHTLGKIVLEGF
jgi:zinc-binding alcohol dehydrogenase family protein